MNSGDLPEDVEQAVKRFERDDRLLKSTAYGDGGASSPPWSRLRRAVRNQCEDGLATGSRYAIWANTVRDHISDAMAAWAAGDANGAERLLIVAHNNLSAYAEVQYVFDPLRDIQYRVDRGDRSAPT